jgi:hypothetical protein
VGASDAADALLGELRTLLERLPLPHPLWHPYVSEMHEVVFDATAALDAVARFPQAHPELRLQVAGDADYPPDGAGGPALAAARARLRALPIPHGEHPYLDEILVALDAAEAALATLAAAGGESAFAAALARLPTPRL